MKSTSGQQLELLYSFFETYGTERLNGLNEKYFSSLNENEREEAWSFLKDGFSLSSERIAGLYLLDKMRAVELFKEALSFPIDSSPFPAERKFLESNRLLILRCINSVEPHEGYLVAMCGFANSEFPKVRAEFAQALPIQKLASNVMESLKGMIFAETELIPLTSAITKFMAIYGMNYDLSNSLYKSIYLSLRSDNPKEKIAGMSRLEESTPTLKRLYSFSK